MMEEKYLTKINKTMSNKAKKEQPLDKGLINPSEIKTPAKKVERKIALNNDIVEREGDIKTEDGRQLLK